MQKQDMSMLTLDLVHMSSAGPQEVILNIFLKRKDNTYMIS